MKESTPMPIASPELVLLMLGMLILLFCIPLLLKLVRPNRFYGIRLQAAFRSEANWYQINSYGAKCLAVFGVIEMLMGFGLKMLSDPPFWLPILCLLATLPLLLLTMRAIKRFALSL